MIKAIGLAFAVTTRAISSRGGLPAGMVRWLGESLSLTLLGAAVLVSVGIILINRRVI